MDTLSDLISRLRDLPALIQWAGYVGLTAIIFVETGLFFGFFLPGDSLLVTAGILSAAGLLDIRLLLVCAGAAAVIGDQTGFFIGRRAGKALTLRYARFRAQLERAHI